MVKYFTKHKQENQLCNQLNGVLENLLRDESILQVVAVNREVSAFNFKKDHTSKDHNLTKEVKTVAANQKNQNFLIRESTWEIATQFPNTVHRVHHD